MISGANQSKIEELNRILEGATAISVGFYSKDFCTYTSRQFWMESEEAGASSFLFLYSNTESVECYLYDEETNSTYFSLWIPTLQGFIVVGPYQGGDSVPGKCLVTFKSKESGSSNPKPFISEHHYVRTLLNSMVRHYFYYYPGNEQGVDWVTNEMNESGADYIHYPYLLEKEFLDYFRHADPGSFEVMREIETQADMELGSSNPERHLRNKLIIICAVLTRTLIESGGSVPRVMKMSYTFLFEIEEASNLKELNTLNAKILDSFYVLVQKERNSSFSPFVRQIRDFIQSHIYNTIEVQMIADYMGITSNYVSTMFKQEYGVSLKRYILDQKVQEAKRLILYSDMSLSEIAACLSFNDQTYFTKVFKRVTGQTPFQYRRQSPPLS
ncbi:helix-turn-helix domain-containing protein [Salibacterium sp. K-3]